MLYQSASLRYYGLSAQEHADLMCDVRSASLCDVRDRRAVLSDVGRNSVVPVLSGIEAFLSLEWDEWYRQRWLVDDVLEAGWGGFGHRAIDRRWGGSC
jgi:hypothetical protein